MKKLKISRNEAKRKCILKCRNASSQHKERDWKSCKNSLHEKDKNGKNVGQSQLLYQRDLNCEKLEKLNRIKEDKLKKSRKFDEKMVDDQKRLTYQLN